MKRTVLFLCIVFTGLAGSAQTVIPNGGFESWDSATYDIPQYYPQSSNPQTYYHCHTAFNITQTTDAYQGTYAVQLTTNASTGDTCGGYFLNATNSNGDPASWEGGIPYDWPPTGIRGYYKYTGVSGDSALIIAIFKQGGNTIGIYTFNIGGTQTTYTLFDFPFVPALPISPDSVILAFAASNLLVTSGVPGSTFLLDSISFTGVPTQPLLMNGDFELWQSEMLYNPVSWYEQNGEGQGVLRTSDAQTGNYAAELQTFLGDNNNTPMAVPGTLSNGFFDNSCSCYMGGSPFANQVDTLAFYYKYSPANVSDTAMVNMSFRQNGSVISGWGMYLTASSNYQYVEIPFSVGSVPDTVVISMYSSLGSDTTFTFLGSTLKIDDLHFKADTTTTGIHESSLAGNDIRFYPNPFRTFATITIDPEVKIDGMELRMYDVFGKTIRKTAIDKHTTILEKNDLPCGVYFYELKNNSGIVRTGKMMVE